MENDKKQKPVTIDNKSFYRTLTRVALPIALQSLIGSSLNLVDNVMVGRLGEAEVAAVGVGIQPFFIFWVSAAGFVSGAAAFMAQFWGAKDIKNIKKTLGFAACVSAVIGILFFVCARFFPEYIVNIFTNIDEIKPLATEYIKIGAFCFLFLSLIIPVTFCLRATQQTRIPLYTSVFAFVANTFLNYVLIFGNFGAPALGVAGAAYATVIARALELLLLLLIVFYRKNIIAGKLREYFGWTKDFTLRVFNVAVPTSLNEALWAFGMAMCTAAYARVGTTEFAAVQASRVVENLFIMAAFSIGDAALILIGQKFGAKELDEGYELAKKLLKIGTCIGLVFGVLLIAVAKPIIGFYNFSPEGQKYAFYILIVYGCFMGVVLFNGINIVGVLRSGGDTKFAMFADCSCLWLVGVPTAFITTQIFRLPIYLCVFLVTMEEVIKFFMLFKRFVSKKWVKNVIKNL